MPVNHIGLTVGDLEEGVRFYTEVCDLTLIGGPGHMDATDPSSTARRREIFGPSWQGMKIAHLADENGTGIELFEFPEPAAVPLPDDLEFWRIGVSHVAVTVADIDVARRSLEEHGGTARTAVFTLAPGCQVCYCRDPWGNAIEFSTFDYRALAAVAAPTPGPAEEPGLSAESPPHHLAPRGGLQLLRDGAFAAIFWGKLCSAVGVWMHALVAAVVVYDAVGLCDRGQRGERRAVRAAAVPGSPRREVGRRRQQGAADRHWGRSSARWARSASHS